MKIRLFIILVAALAIATGAKSQVVDTSFYQAKRGHYLAVEAGYGMMSIYHKMRSELNTTDLKYGIQARATYRWYILKHFAIGTGIHYQQMGSSSTLNNTQQITDAVDELGRKIEHRTLFHGLEETDKAHAFSIPAGLYYHGGQMAKRLKLNVGAGVMFNFVVANSFKTKGDLETRLYYNDYNLELGNITGHNVYTANGFSGKYNDFIPSLSIYGELGFIYSVNRKLDITLSALAAYGLNPTISSEQNVYDPDCMAADRYQNPGYNGVLASQESYGVRLLNIGGLVGIRYHIKSYDISQQELSHDRRRHDMQNYDINRNNRQEFERQERKRREDSIRLADEERKAREIKEAEFERQRRDSIERATADSIAYAKALADSIEAANNTITHSVSAELDSLIRILNNNKCKYNASELSGFTSQQKKSIKRLAQLMMMFPSIEIYCYGHTCDIGDMETNKALGMKRAEAFAAELIRNGVNPSQIECGSKWFKEPLVPNTSESNRAINRRVELVRKQK